MAHGSSVARMQRALVLGLGAAAVVWWIFWWPAHPGLAALGPVAALFGHGVLLGLEFLMLRPASRGDPAPRPQAVQLLRAWWAEIVQDLRVFAWRQPFRWREVPDHLPASACTQCGIVFIHGFVCNRGFWTPWLERARALGHPFVAINLEPVFGSIDDYGGRIEQAVVQVSAATGRPPVLVCHSMGGLAARAWWRRHAGEGRVAHVVTIGTPHRGTWLARFSRLANGRQMRMGGDWLRELEATEVPRAGVFTCWYSNCDNVVFPPRTATLAHADNRLVEGAAHVDLAFRPRVMNETFALLKGL